MSDVTVTDPVDQTLDQAQSQEGGDTATQDTVTTPPAGDESGNGGIKDSSTSQEDIAAKREAGKLRQYQETLKKAGINDINEVGKLAEAKKNYDAFVQKSLESPDRYKRTLMEYAGYDEQGAEAAVVLLKQQGYWKQAVQPQQTQQSLDRDTVAKIVQETVQQDRQALEFKRKFFEALPEIDPEKIRAEEKPYAEAMALAIAEVARKKIEADPSSDYIQEAKKAYQKITGKSAEEIESARENGYYEGLTQRNMKNNANSPTRGGSSSTPTHNLTAQQLAEAKAEGLSPEEYIKYSGGFAQAK